MKPYVTTQAGLPTAAGISDELQEHNSPVLPIDPAGWVFPMLDAHALEVTPTVTVDRDNLRARKGDTSWIRQYPVSKGVLPL